MKKINAIISHDVNSSSLAFLPHSYSRASDPLDNKILDDVVCVNY